MPNQSIGVFPIRRGGFVPDADQEVVDFAFNLWLARCFRGGSPEEDLLAAMYKLRRNTPAKLFLVPKRDLMRR